MSNAPDLISFEHQGWKALSTGPERATKFYRSVLADNAQMLFPGGMRLVGKSQILQMMGGSPWESYEISEAQEIFLSDTARLITYKVTAQRAGDDPYQALISSAYALRGDSWQLFVHQQTPE